jgi:hypothetical protein
MPVLSFPRFHLGRTVATPGALETLADLFGVGPGTQKLRELMGRHHTGDWGDLDAHDTRANEQALRDGVRLLSAYNLPGGTRIWIITEWDRSATTVLLPEEY